MWCYIVKEMIVNMIINQPF